MNFLCLLSLLLISVPAALAQGGPPSRTIVIFGDSITAGGALPKDQRGQLWVTLVEKEAAGALKLVNEGKGSRPTASLPDFDAMLKRRPRADALVIALGMNDSRDITSGCVPKAVANVRAMIEKARQTYGAGIPVLLVGPTNINQSALGPTKPIGDQREAKLRELGAAFEKLASETSCRFTSLYDIVPDAALLKDGVHPDGAGNAAIAKALGGEISALSRLPVVVP